MADKVEHVQGNANQMNLKMFPGLTIDGLMIISALLAMANKLTDNPMHELIGMTMLCLVIIHNLLNWKWYGATMGGKYNMRRIIDCTVIILLIAIVATLAGSSIVISRTLFTFHGMKASLTMQQLHTTAAYWFLLLTSVHLGVHWTGFSASLKKVIPVLSSIRLPAVFRLLLSTTAVVYGGMAAFDRGFCSRLFMAYAFDFWDFEQSTAGFFLNYLAIMTAIAVVTNNGLKIIQFFKNRRKQVYKVT